MEEIPWKEIKEMNINIISERRVRQIIKEEISKKINYLERELDKLRLKVVDLEILIENGKRKLD